MSTQLPDFLSLDEVLELHTEALAQYGGAHGVRDQAGLESAVNQAMSGHSQGFFHEQPFGMAAAYLYYIAAAQHLVDGNKRTALAAALVFLERYGITMAEDDPGLCELTLGVAEGSFTIDKVKEELEAAAARAGGARP